MVQENAEKTQDNFPLRIFGCFEYNRQLYLSCFVLANQQQQSLWHVKPKLSAWLLGMIPSQYQHSKIMLCFYTGGIGGTSNNNMSKQEKKIQQQFSCNSILRPFISHLQNINNVLSNFKITLK